jgi:hypothetical protein
MIKGKIALTVGLLSTTAIFAAGVVSASANTAYLCSSTALSKTFSDAHCKTSGGTAYGHVSIPVNTATLVTTTNVTTGTERSILKLKSIQSGVTLELQATGVEGTGTLKNLSEGSNTWSVYAPVLTLKGVTVTAPAGKGCVVTGGTITTKELAVTSKELTNQLKFSPASGTTWAEFLISGCSVAALNHAYNYTGSLIGSTSGSTVTFAHSSSTSQGTFFTSGQKAGLEGSFTLKDETTGDGIAFT